MGISAYCYDCGAALYCAMASLSVRRGKSAFPGGDARRDFPQNPIKRWLLEADFEVRNFKFIVF